MKHLRKVISVILSFVLINTAVASDYTGKVEAIVVREYDGLIYVHLSGSRSSDIPNCAKNTSYMMIKNENSTIGKRLLAILMLAQASNRTVAIEGANTCLRWHDGEDIAMITLLRK